MLYVIRETHHCPVCHQDYPENDFHVCAGFSYPCGRCAFPNQDIIKTKPYKYCPHCGEEL